MGQKSRVMGQIGQQIWTVLESVGLDHSHQDMSKYSLHSLWHRNGLICGDAGCRCHYRSNLLEQPTAIRNLQLLTHRHASSKVAILAQAEA